eukprot:scaffold97570_cov72-Phaeocystis_antarctica.AAC.3
MAPRAYDCRLQRSCGGPAARTPSSSARARSSSCRTPSSLCRVESRQPRSASVAQQSPPRVPRFAAAAWVGGACPRDAPSSSKDWSRAARHQLHMRRQQPRPATTGRTLPPMAPLRLPRTAAPESHCSAPGPPATRDGARGLARTACPRAVPAPPPHGPGSAALVQHAAGPWACRAQGGGTPGRRSVLLLAASSSRTRTRGCSRAMPEAAPAQAPGRGAPALAPF